MEAQAPYSISATPLLADLRELVTLVAAWLEELWFLVLGCGAVAGAQYADVAAPWCSPAVAVFLLELRAEAERPANCERLLEDWQ